MKYQLLLILSLGIFLTSCKSEEEKRREQLYEKITKSWMLLDSASTKKETSLTIPLGFQLGCTSKEFEIQCDTLVKRIGGENHSFTWNSGYTGVSDTYVKTNVFGGVKKEVMIPHDNYVNPKIKYINKIAFRFIEFQSNWNLDGGWETFRDSISSKFDESWETVEFNLMDASDVKPLGGVYGMGSNYYKYWVRGNMAVEFNFDGHCHYPTLTFYNVPKYGAKNIKVSMPVDDGDDDYLKYKQYDEKAATKKRLDKWHKTYREWLRNQ